MSAISGDFVRAIEWRRVQEFATDAAGRVTPTALVVEGEAGAGKSRLWRAALAVAAGAGCRVLRSEPSATEADSPFAGLSDLLAGILPSLADGIPGPQREAIEVALLLRPAGDTAPTAHAIGLAVLAALRSCVDDGPVLLAIDDAQWLDAGSLEALGFALRRIIRGPLSLLLAARCPAPADPLTLAAPPLPQGWRELPTALHAATPIMLAPLDALQVQGLLPPTATPAQARLVARQSRGNPFWAGEIWASMASAESGVPPLARAALAWRLERSLTPAATDALAVVAAAGRITVSDAVAVLDDLDDPAGALDAAVLAGVIVETEGRVAAAHPLIGVAAVESVPPCRRGDIYRRLAAVSPSPERRAHFAALAAGPGPDNDVAAALDAAADAAHARAANAAAGKFAAQAVMFTPAGTTAADPASPASPAAGAAQVQRRIRAGELLFLAGELSDSLEHLEALDADALPTADLERALPLLADGTDFAHGTAAATALITRALDACGTDHRRRALLLSLASDVAYGIRGGRRAAAIEAISCAEAAGPVADLSLHRALVNLVIAKATAGEGLDAALLERAEGLERAVPRIPLHDTADLHRGLWACCVEDLDTSRSALLRSIARARETGEDFGLSTCLAYLAQTEELAGDYAAAAAALAEADKVAAWYGWPVSPWMLESRCELLIATGELDATLRLADEHLPDDEREPAATRFMGACVRGKVSFWSGDAVAAVRHLELAVRYADQFDWADPGVRSRIDQLLAEAYVTAGRAEEASPISAKLRELGTRRDRPTLIGDACRIDALAAAARGDLETARESARAAVTAHERSPLRPELARSLLVLGRIERRRKARGQSRAALWRARNLAVEMDHRPLLAEIDAELPRATAARSATGLTDAEQRVADQIADGATYREAAAELFVSVRTVETHVASIHRKLGVRTRSELRRALSQ
jgi:DNA-binding CsgD family transcriptional regulator/tetratricopeptide (TPR) repeat protein